MDILDIRTFSLEEKISFLRQNPIFWSRFGHELEHGHWEQHLLNAKRHKALREKGILIHSSVIPSGWTGPEQYDYTETDQLLDLLFTLCPDIIFLPRVKLNVPEGWCAAHPEDVFVYAGGPRTADGISALIGTNLQGAHPQKATDLIAQQSLWSSVWVRDASEAIRRFVSHVEAGPWANWIIGYHVAYGTCGECTQWASWETNPVHKGDYGIHATRAFLDYAAERGKHYDDIPPVNERFFITDAPVPQNRYHIGRPTLDQLFYHTEKDERCVLYSEFTRDSNAGACEALCRAVKEIVPDKVAGVFHGYISEPENCANVQHTGFQQLLSSPYVDFLAGPKGYNRVGPMDPGFGQAVPNSVNRKKLWLDEIDNRTYLCRTNGSKDYTAANFAQTRAVYWREFTKNIAFGQGYWWMDLMGGWLDSEDIRNEIGLLNDTAKLLWKDADKQRSISEVLLAVDEDVMHHMRPNWNLHEAVIHHTGSVFKECGVPVDYYRMSDLAEMDLSKYRLIVFLNAFCEDPIFIQKILSKAADDCVILWNYTAGILNNATGSFDLANMRMLTGFSAVEYQDPGTVGEPNSCYPIISIKSEEGIFPMDFYPDGKIKAALRREDNGRYHILQAMPRDLTVEKAREILTMASVYLYAPGFCTVNADSRFIYVLAEKDIQAEVNLKEPGSYENVFTGEVFRNATALPLKLDAGTCVFYRKLMETENI